MADLLAGFSMSTFLASLVGSGVTASVVLRGLSGHLGDRWLAKYKSDLDKEFESYRDTLERKRKRLEAEMTHRVYTTQTRFDTEFNAIKEIFSALGKLRLAFNGMRPFLDRAPQDQQDKRTEIVRRLRLLSEHYNASVDVVNSVYPFVPEDIYEELDKCLMAAMLEIKHVEEAGEDALSHEGYSDGAKQHDRFTTAYFKAAKLVRERFNHLSVVSQ
jgi:hypothetical protein